MKAIRLAALFSLVMLQNAGLGQNIITNGGFENDFTGWVPVESASISTSEVQSGANSLLASDTAKNSV